MRGQFVVEMLCQQADSESLYEASRLLEEALPIARHVGMQPLAQRFEALRQKTVAAALERQSHPDGLTKREMEVLRLAARPETGKKTPNLVIVSPFR